MSVEFLNSNQVYAEVNEAYKQAVGEKAIATQNISGLVSPDIKSQLGDYREQFTQALILQGVRSVFMDSMYRRAKEAGFRTDDMQFKAILQAITITAPEVQAAHNWKVFTDGDNIGVYQIKLPRVDTAIYGETASWELQYDMTGTQWDDAWTSEADLVAFYGAIRLAIANAIEAHDEELDDTMRNTLIVELVKNSKKVGSHSLSVVDLRLAYNAEMKPATPVKTFAEFFSNKECLRFMARKLVEFKDYFKKMSKLFNMAQRATFTPVDRIKLQVLGYAEQAYNSILQSQTFNEIFTKLPLYETIPYWQGTGLQDATSTTLSPDELSKISITDGTNATTIEGVVALLADKWSCLHGLKSPRRVVTEYHKPEDVTQTFIQTHEMRAIMSTQNAVVFIVSTDPSVTLDQNEVTIEASDTVTLKASTYPAGETVTWTSSNTSAATVSSGVVTGVAAGKTTITASITVGGNTYTDTCAVTVTAAS